MIERFTDGSIPIQGDVSRIESIVNVSNEIANTIVRSAGSDIRRITLYAFSRINISTGCDRSNFFKMESVPLLFIESRNLNGFAQFRDACFDIGTIFSKHRITLLLCILRHVRVIRLAGIGNGEHILNAMRTRQ